MYIYCIYTHRQTNFIHLSTFLRHFLIQFTHNDLFVVDTVSLLTERLYSTLILGRSVNILPFSIWTVSWPQSWNRSGELCYLIGATGRLIVTLIPYHPLFPVVFWQPDWIIVPNNCITCMPWWQTHSLQTGRLSVSCIYFPLLAYFLIPSFIKHSGPLPPSILWWTQEGRIEFFQIIVSDRQPKAPFTRSDKHPITSGEMPLSAGPRTKMASSPDTLRQWIQAEKTAESNYSIPLINEYNHWR